jgi:hypothetical protein
LGGGTALGLRRPLGSISYQMLIQVNKGGFPLVGRGLPGAVTFRFAVTDVDRSYLSAA